MRERSPPHLQRSHNQNAIADRNVHTSPDITAARSVQPRPGKTDALLRGRYLLTEITTSSATEVARCSACKLSLSKASFFRGGISRPWIADVPGRQCQTPRVWPNSATVYEEDPGQAPLPQSRRGESCSAQSLQECEEPQSQTMHLVRRKQRSLLSCSFRFGKESVPCICGWLRWRQGCRPGEAARAYLQGKTSFASPSSQLRVMLLAVVARDSIVTNTESLKMAESAALGREAEKAVSRCSEAISTSSSSNQDGILEFRQQRSYWRLQTSTSMRCSRTLGRQMCLFAVVIFC